MASVFSGDLSVLYRLAREELPHLPRTRNTSLVPPSHLTPSRRPERSARAKLGPPTLLPLEQRPCRLPGGLGALPPRTAVPRHYWAPVIGGVVDLCDVLLCRCPESCFARAVAEPVR